MAGIYIHIPFCRKKCIYCDFYSVVSSHVDYSSYVDYLVREYHQRKTELGDETIKTIYIGGGTPSLLSLDLIQRLKNGLDCFSNVEEFTIEVNPDDVTTEYAEGLRKIGVNRVSMGVQSFIDEELELINRRHTAQKAIDSYNILKNAGFENMSLDLIFGIPKQTLESWKYSVEKAIELNPTHISAYSLMYEEGTRLTLMRNKGLVEECEDEVSVAMYDYLVPELKKAGYDHYEISNFAKPDRYSRHNASYWDFTPYLGLGASAHSFDGKIRRYNPSNWKNYEVLVNEQGFAYKEEHENTDELYNEWVMTMLRTKWGINMHALKERFGQKYFDWANKIIKPYIADGSVVKVEDTIHLTEKGVMVSDMIYRDLFIV